ncbi:hypothetical protein [Streptococcus uberis]|uniref:hypothetical protein n=2 Tax=Streptococcus uberis TaxID=1349 RepID=UPI0012B52D1D|nr:hypothetical protein [Streptococcus uberis]MTB35393.1 hypothetical protein [Streptococcus uberis]MTB56656.1 hypothetical protein [Streptococcus uberis]
MRMLLQQGYGMMSLNLEFVNKYDDIGFILSPRALQSGQEPKRLKEHANQIKKQGGKILFDPQFYQPRTNLDKILTFPYFNGLNYETATFTGDSAKIFSQNVVKFQKDILEVDEFIIPGIYTNNFSESWINQQEDLLAGALSSDIDGTFYQTISIGSDFVLDERFGDFVGQLTIADVDGYYLTFKRPTTEYSVSDTVYLYNLLDAILSLKLSGKKVIIGYANPQDLIFSAVGLDGIASGNYQNVRGFNPEIFFASNEFKRKSVWFYDNNTFSEFRPEQLSLPQKRNKLQLFEPYNEYTKDFLNANPISNYPWTESNNFKNYLYNMYKNCKDINQNKDRFSYVESMFSEKEKNLNILLKSGIREGNRTFSLASFDSSLSALSAIKNDRADDISELESLY